MRKKIGYFGFLIFFICSCGRNEEFVFTTRELSPAEIVAQGYDREAPTFDLVSSEGSGTLVRPVSFVEAGSVVNLIAGTVHKLIEKDKPTVDSTVLAHATPPGVSALEMTKGKSKFKVYEKVLTSSAFRSKLISITYKISYQHGATYKKKGNYLTNVKFTPLKVETSTLWSLRASAVSEEATNVGTDSDPIASVDFSLTFTAEGTGQGTRGVTDEFQVEGKKGEMKATVREFE